MRGFFKIFFASFLALIVFTFLGVFIFIGVVGALASSDKPDVPSKSILVLDLGKHFPEVQQTDLASKLNGTSDIPGLYDVIRLIQRAKTDDDISGIYIEADNNANGFASSNEIRRALVDFRASKKFVIAHGDLMTQGAYFVANAADKVYVNPSGNFEWKGYAVHLLFLKGLLDKLEIQPQVFYAGKYKSATEPLRTTSMTPENKLQTTEWLGDLYNHFLVQTAGARGVDTATLHRLADSATIQTPGDAVNTKLIDAVKYDDEVKTELKQLLKIGKTDKMNFVSMETYHEAVNTRKTGKDRVAVIYAEGDIVDGDGSNENIGGDRFRALIRKARLDNSVKAIVLRVNSGGGSALASEIMWRELKMAKDDGKPVVVSMGDVAASGGYYIACGADSIFASPNTITGSIGVFGIIPNMSGFFREKLGITFDGVKTATYADGPTAIRPMNDMEKRLTQAGVDRIYLRFKQRVADGRKKDINYVDSIAQGRVWSGEDALRLGLVDRIGGLHDAIASAVKLAKLSDYGIKEYPESQNWLEDILKPNKKDPSAFVKEQLGEENYKVYREMLRVREMTRSTQARLPFEFFIH